MKNPLASLVRWLDRRLNKPTGRSFFQGAAFDRFAGDWGRAQLLSPNQETKSSLPTLRARARQLERDNAHIAGLVLAFQDNVVGWNGIRLQARLEKPRAGFHVKHNAVIEEAFGAWSEYGVPTVDGYYSFADLQRLLIARLIVDGEFILRHIRGYPNGFGYALQILDPDQLDDTYNVAPNDRQLEIRQGVEINGEGRPVAYHLMKAHPSESGIDRRRFRVPADEIIHRFIPRRPGQPRGIPALSAVLVSMRDLDAYQEAEIKAARLAASYGGFFVTKGESADLSAIYTDNEVATQRDRLQMEVEPGLSRALPAGMEFQPWAPQHPNGNFENFDKAILKTIARGLGISYTTFSGDLREVNFTSSRVGLLQERDFFRGLQRWFGCSTLTPIYREWVRYAYLAGKIKLPTDQIDSWGAHEWKYRGWAHVQPREEIEALEKGVHLGVMSRQEICAMQGYDYEEIVGDLREEADIAEEQDVDVSGSDSKQGNVNGNQAEADPNAAPGDDAGSGDPDGRQSGRSHSGLAVVRSAG